MTPKLVSVVIPAYNAAGTISDSISSALAQSHRNVEVIVCDDASSDDTAGIVAAVKDPRVRLVRNETNMGPGGARDRAIELAKGDWIALLDADDCWTPERIECLLSETTGSELVFDDTRLCFGSRGRFVEGPRLHGSEAFGCGGRPARVPLQAFLASDRLLIHPIFPASVVREHRIHHSERRFGEDAEFYINLALMGVPMLYVPQAHYLYRIAPGSLTSAPAARGEMRNMLSTFLDHPALSGAARGALVSKLERLALDDLAHEAGRMLRRGDFLGAARLVIGKPAVLRRAISRSPTRLKFEFRRLTAMISTANFPGRGQ